MLNQGKGRNVWCDGSEGINKSDKLGEGVKVHQEANANQSGRTV